MLPSLLVRDIQQGIKQFLLTGFEPSDSFFSGVMQRFVDEESAWMKGPYLQLGLPFRLGESGKTFFTGFTTENSAYIYQEAAWNRLTSNKLAANTLVAMGNFLRGRSYGNTIVYNRSGDAKLAWEMALAAKDQSLDLPDSFYESELEQVVLPQGISTLDEYRLAKRVGRGGV